MTTFAPGGIYAVFQTLSHIQHFTLHACPRANYFTDALEVLLPPDVRPCKVEVLPALRVLTLKLSRIEKDQPPNLSYYLAALVKRRVSWDTPELRVEL